MFASFVAVVEDGEYWRLLKPLVYVGHTDTFTVPAGFRTDFASVPHWATWLLPRTGRHNRAAVLHDYLSRVAAGKVDSCPNLPNHGCGLPTYVSRADADGIFLRVLRELGVQEWRARLMYLGVRLAWHLRL